MSIEFQRSRRRLFAAGASSLLALALVACGGEGDPAETSATQGGGEPVFTFTAIPDDNPTLLQERFAAVADYLEAELGVPVEYVPVKSYAAAVSAFTNDEVQLAWFGGLSGVQARLAVPGSRAIAQGAEDPEFLSYFIAHTDTGIEPSEDFPEGLRDRRFTFGSKSSTSGRLMPEFFLRTNTGELPDEFFGEVGFSGDHASTIDLVASGAFEAGAVNYLVWDRKVAEGEVDTDVVQVVWTTPPYPDYNWTARGDLDERFGDGFTDRVQAAIVDLEDPELLAALERSDFIPASNSDFQTIEDTARAVGIIRD